MSTKFVELSFKEFAEELGAKKPVPGGGAVAAMVGILGSGLCSMVGSFTLGRKKYAQYEEDIQSIMKEAEEIRDALCQLVDEDAENFEPLSRAYSIPKDDPQRESILQRESLNASNAPLKMMRITCRCIELLEEMMVKGTITLASDVGCGALCCRAALEAAAMNVLVNTKSLPIEVAGEIESEVKDLLVRYIPRAEIVSETIMSRLYR